MSCLFYHKNTFEIKLHMFTYITEIRQTGFNPCEIIEIILHNVKFIYKAL